MQGDYKNFEAMSELDVRPGFRVFRGELLVGRWCHLAWAAIAASDLCKGHERETYILDEATGKRIAMALTDSHGTRPADLPTRVFAIR
jgi:hypothetical protein